MLSSNFMGYFHLIFFFLVIHLEFNGREFWKAAVVLCFLEEMTNMRLRTRVWNKETGLKSLYIL